MADNDFEYGDEFSDGTADSPGGHADHADKVITNQPHDEEVALSEEDDEESQASPVGVQKRAGGDSPPPNVSDDERDSEDDEGVESPEDSPGGAMSEHMHQEMPKQEPVRLDGLEPRSSLDQGGKKGGSEDSSDEEEDKEGLEPGSAGGYNPDDYAHLKMQVSEEVNELFQYIGRYKPHNHQLDTKLKPFIPDYIPAVGDIDEFIKVARPDGKPDDLGLKVLDEPAAKQSDPTVLNLQLRAVSKQSNLRPMEVTAVEGAERDPKKVANWISSIQDLHKNKPRAQVAYSKMMPDIEQLMQEWPPEVEEMMQHLKLPDETLDLEIAQYCKTMCAILDIPVYNNVVESLHVMFTLYLEFKNNPFLAGKKEPASPQANVFSLE